MKIIQRFSNLKIGWKLGGLFGIIIIFGWLNGALFFYVNSRMEMDGRIINVAGRQRMLTQKMTKEALIIMNESSPQNMSINLTATRALFEQSHQGLRFGDASLGVPRTNNPQAISQWQVIDILWSEFRTHIIEVENSVGLVQDHVEHIIALNDRLLDEIDLLVTIFEQELLEKHSLATAASILSAISMTLIAGFSLFYIIREVSQPLVHVAETATTIAEGNLSVTFTGMENRTDEIGILHNALKDMQIALRTEIEQAEKLLYDNQVHHLVLENQKDQITIAHDKLEESLNKYSDLYDNSPVGYFTFGIDGKTLEVNLAGARQLDMDRNGLIKTPFFQYIETKDRDAFFSHQKAVFSTGEQQSCEIKLIKTNGIQFYAQLVSISVQNHQGKISQCRTTIIDITERKQAEDALLKSKEQYQMLIENSEVGILSIESTEGKINYFNPKAGQILDYFSDQLTSMTFFDFIVPENVAKVKNILQRKLKEENLNNTIVEDYEFQAVRGNGKRIWLKMNISPIVRIEKRPEIQCYFWDITQEKELQEIRDRFIVTTSHELRTPMTVIKGWIDFLGKHPPLSREELNSIYLSIDRGIHRLTRLIDNVHDLTTLRGHIFPLSRRKISITEFVETLQEEIRLVYPRRAILINYQESNHLVPQIYLDPDRIFQVIHNLVSNAVKNSPQDSLVEITIMRDSQEIFIQIEDYGVGISVANLFQIFQPFSHIPSEYSAVGIGLGLYITKNIVHTHGGTISLETRENRGTNFLVTIPTVNPT